MSLLASPPPRSPESKTPTFVMATRGYADGPTDRPAPPPPPRAGSSANRYVSFPNPILCVHQSTDSKIVVCGIQAQENQYVQQAEKEKLAKLRESIKKQREHLDQVENQLKDLEKK